MASAIVSLNHIDGLEFVETRTRCFAAENAVKEFERQQSKSGRK